MDTGDKVRRHFVTLFDETFSRRWREGVPPGPIVVQPVSAELDPGRADLGAPRLGHSGIALDGLVADGSGDTLEWM